LITALLVPAAPSSARKTPPENPRKVDISGAAGDTWGVRPRDALTTASPAISFSTPPSGSCSTGSPLGSSSVKRFGYYNPITGLAVEDGVWTFDHMGGPWEGWTRADLTRDQFTAFQFVDTTVWNAHPTNFPPNPVITGDGSLWLGFHEDEADAACWVGGLGYGNNWGQRIRSPAFVNTTGGSIDLVFDYWYDCEPGYDFVKVIYQSTTNDTSITIATFTGRSGSSAAPLHFSQSVGVTEPDTFRVVFEFTSDGAFSDEDGSYSTTVGPFGADDIYVDGVESTIGAPSPPYTFDTGLQGWLAGPIPGVGSYAALHDFAGYSLPGCGQDANVVAFHPPNPIVGHPAGQHERITSPTVDISSYGPAPLNVWGQYDIYADNAAADNVFWTWGFQYYPDICPVTGDSVWSDPQGPSLLFYTNSPFCATVRSFANDTSSPGISSSGTTLIPAGADSVRFCLEVVSMSSSPSGNETPLFDNMQVGVSDAGTVIHVPSPEYPDIATGVFAAGDGDTVAVAAGTYYGVNNRNIDFDGTDLVLISEDGPTATFVDCQKLGRGLYFHSFEADSAEVNGFTFVHGTQQTYGSLIYIANSNPTIRNCRFNETRVLGGGYGVLRMDSGAPTFECCSAAYDTTTTAGGIVRVLGGSPTFDTCTIGTNVAQSQSVALVGGTPSLTGCSVVNNTTANAVSVNTAATLTGCSVSNNSGLGMYFYAASPSLLTSCTIAGNGAGGITLEANSSTFSSCSFLANQGPGIAITNVLTLAAGPGGGQAAPTGVAATTEPVFTNCRIAGNVNTSSSGGGILLDCSNIPVDTFSPFYDNCIITGNSSLFSGGGIAVCGYALYTNIAPLFQNCTISANNAGVNGGGIYVAADNGEVETYFGYVTMARTIMWGNCSDGMGGEVYMESSNYLSFDCSSLDSLGVGGAGQILYGSQLTFEDPGFCDAAVCDPSGTIEGNFTIELGSPADSLNSPCKQLIGANPAVCEPVSSVEDESNVPEYTALWQNVPNPFNPSTTIRFDIAAAGRVALRIYDVEGRLVKTLVDERLPASSQAVEWNGTDNRGRHVASGVYFARLVAGDVTETRKMVLLK